MERGVVCLSVWWFVWVVLVGLCPTCVYNIIFRLICIMRAPRALMSA